MKWIQTVPVIVSLLALVPGCKGKSAEEICTDSCNKQEECELSGGVSKEDCIAQCEEDLEDVGNKCLNALDDFGKCQNKASCDELSSGSACLGEAISALGDCPELLEGSDDCCGEVDSCGWGSDGVCDCNGAASWETDCG